MLVSYLEYGIRHNKMGTLCVKIVLKAICYWYNLKALTLCGIIISSKYLCPWLLRLHIDLYLALLLFVCLSGDFIYKVSSLSPTRHFIIHSRKALLNGLSPAENRSIPPLKYVSIKFYFYSHYFYIAMEITHSLMQIWILLWPLARLSWLNIYNQWWH